MALLALFLNSCWLFICSSFFRVLKLITTVFPFRLSGEDGSFDCLFLKSWNNGNSDFSKKICFNTKEEEKEDGISERDQIHDPISKNEFLINRVDDDRIPEKKLSFESEESESIDFEKVLDTKHQIMDSEEPSYSFRFQFQTDKDLKQRLEELEIEGLDGWFSETNSSDVLSDNREKSNNCFEFLSEKDFRDFVAESSVGSNSTHDFDTNLEDEFLSDNDFLEIDLRKETEDFLIDEDGFKNSVSNEETLDFLSKKDFRRSKSNPETKTELFEARTEQYESRTEQSETITERCETPMDPLTDSDGENPDWVDDFEKNEDTQVMDYDYEKDEDDGLEVLWEHEDLIEQLRTELGKVRAVGLPTILEDSECPKFTDDLKPWKIDQKFLKEDRMGELQKFYKSYSERMRKLDIFNYQKMYAIGFLKLKDPLSKATSHRDTFPAIIRRNLRLCRGRKLDADPSAKVMRELEGDLETVYVGQTCLSWEILHWQYLKAEELMDSDPTGSRRYDDVAGELQRFQVLLDRFLENEPFQGPTRVENYVGNRCVLRNLLQVPLVREEKKARRKGGIDGVTIEMMVEILQESMRVFWNFVKADKDETLGVLKGFLSTQAELQDLELLADIQASLQKKEKKLKDLVRSGSCLVKKFQKQQISRGDQVLFFTQVDMKLVSRVLRMSRITSDQLMWCHKKLNKIALRGRSLYREPSFLLFPC